MNPNIQRAVNILRNHYRKLAERSAAEIVEHWQDFDSLDSGVAEALIEKHSRRMCELSHVFQNLEQFASRKKSEGKEPLGKDEFRCFGCGGVIRKEDEACKICGWVWK